MPLILAIVAVLAALWVFLWIRGSMDVDNVIDFYNHEEGRKQAAWEKAYNAALDRWDELAVEERAKHIEDWITNNDGVPLIARAFAVRDHTWRERAEEIMDDVDLQASNAWATEQARMSLENTEGE